MGLKEKKEQLVEAFKTLSRLQNVVEDTHGNVSCRLDYDQFLIKPSGMQYDEITTDDVVSCFFTSGSPCRWIGDRKPSVDMIHHANIYALNENVMSICHTHSPYATSFAIARRSMPVLCTEHADYFGHEIRCLDYRDLDIWGSCVRLEKGEQAVLLGGHGVLVCCESYSPVKAVKLAAALESIAKKYTLAAMHSDTVGVIPPDDVEKWHKRYKDGYGQ